MGASCFCTWCLAVLLPASIRRRERDEPFIRLRQVRIDDWMFETVARPSGGRERRNVANSGKAATVETQRFQRTSQRNQAWSGRRESNSRSQLGKLMKWRWIAPADQYLPLRSADHRPWSAIVFVSPPQGTRSSLAEGRDNRAAVISWSISC
jgi:hypothetical protein